MQHGVDFSVFLGIIYRLLTRKLFLPKVFMTVSNDEKMARRILVIGVRLSVFRAAAGLTRAALSEKCGVSQDWIYKIEKGKNTSIETLLKICDGIGVQPAGVLLNIDQKNGEQIFVAHVHCAKYLKIR